MLESNLMEYLGLTRYFPSQLSIQDAMSMMSIDEDKNQAHTGLPSLLLYYLMKNDFRWRDKVQQLIPNAGECGKDKQSILTSTHLEKTKSENACGSFLDEGFDLEPSSTTVIHPNDTLLNTILCCNLEFKQVIFQKLFMCKQSVPLIYQIPESDRPCYSLFPLRSMTMECRTKEGATVLCAATMKSKVVGFIRVGNSRQSKSKLLNDVLNEQKHATFCHRDVLFESTKPLNAKGLVEAAWFLPSGKPSDPFEEVITFLNLRGDAACMPNEITITGRIASAIVTLIDTSCLGNKETIVTMGKLCECQSHIIVLLTNNFGGVSTEKVEFNLRQCFPNPKKVKVVTNFNWKTNNLKTEVTVRKEVVTAIKEIIERKTECSLRECGNTLCQGKQVNLDEKTEDSVEGNLAAKQIFSGLCSPDEATRFLRNDVEKIPTVTSKEGYLPLQGKLWKRWSELNKKQHKNKGGGSINDVGKIQNEMDEIQRKQAKQLCQLTQSMSSFTEYLFKPNKSLDGYPTFLLWLKLMLNENSRNVLPGLLTEFRQSWLKFSAAKDKKNNENEIKALQEAAEQAEIKLATASFGIEHFMRELSQLYESALLSRQPISGGNISHEKLPKVMADLILKGQAFEIIDGDAANIAINWIKDVLKHLEKEIGRKKLFIVSVLGIQSSGKSTLLNALFGLQFTVSAGRCTRGVFGQLVPVDKRRNLPYDYILVVDTEGLRAPELGQAYLDHDNELATFVIGIGDVTLINIKGENTAEMKDVLQITVQAFLRMKLANSKMELKRRCIFIHQNVGAVNAEEQMMQGLKKFQENLDMMTQTAAEEENMRHIQSFSEIIDFQGDEHVLYFPNLWCGDPPMAPSNSGYSMKVVEVLQRLEKMASRASALTTIDGLTHRIEDLWNGILAENFVFSFRNTLEIKTYNSMESKFQTLTGEYSHYVMEWFEKEASIEIELCKSEDKLKECCLKLKRSLLVGFIQRKADIEKKLIDYFDNNELNDILIQWKNSRVIKFQHMAETVERSTMKYIEQKIEEQRIVILSNTTNMKLEKHINARAKELAETCQGKHAGERELESMFNKFWNQWTSEYIKAKPSNFDPESITSHIISNLLHRLVKYEAIVVQELKDRNGVIRLPYLNIPRLEDSWTTMDINLDHISIKSLLERVSKFIPRKGKAYNDKLKTLAIEYTNNVFRKIDVAFENLLKKDVLIGNEYAKEIINKTVEEFERENSLPDHELTFQTPYEVKLVVHVCSYARTQFTFMAERYEKKHGVKGKLDAYKMTAKHLFLNTVQKKSDEYVAADFFCDRVKERVIDTIKATIPRQIVDEILRKFSYTKYHLMLYVMEYLAKQRHFRSFVSYIRDSHSFVHSWMDEFIKKSIFGTNGASRSRYEEFASGRLGRIMKCIQEAINYATEQTTSRAVNWAQSFESRVKTELAVPSDILDPVTKKITDVKDFKHLLSDKIANLEDEVLEEFRGCNPDSIVWKGESPNESVMKEIWGCPEYCPFCVEPCKHNEGHLTDDISHSCIQHRPVCVRGTRWIKDEKLVIETCNFKVQSDTLFNCAACSRQCRKSGKYTTTGDETTLHPFKEYKSFVPDWDIAPNATMEATKYWMWFVAKYLGDLVLEYNAKIPEIPSSWKTISDEDALESLRVARE